MLIIPPDFKQRYVKVLQEKGPNDPLIFSAIMLDILIMHDPDKYFEKATKKPYTTFLENYHYNVSQEFGIDIKLPKGWEWPPLLTRRSWVISTRLCKYL